MKKLITILSVLIISTNLLAQSIGTVSKISVYHYQADEWEDKGTEYKYITFGTMDIGTLVDGKMRIILDDGRAKYITEAAVIDIKGSTAGDDHVSVVLFSEITGPMELWYDENYFSLSYNYSRKNNDKKAGYTRQLYGTLKL
jgi:hypothetical protein